MTGAPVAAAMPIGGASARDRALLNGLPYARRTAALGPGHPRDRRLPTPGTRFCSIVLDDPNNSKRIPAKIAVVRRISLSHVATRNLSLSHYA